jgi:hypothetical protein
VVQGYKFNIFYPDLIDKSKAPTYYIKKIPGDMDTQIIVFTAGPPYEDIAFRIVRRPWEYSHRRGFRSLFDKGVLQCTSDSLPSFLADSQCTSILAETFIESKQKASANRVSS